MTALGVDLYRYQVGDGVHRPLHGRHYALRVGHEHRERAQLYGVFGSEHAAVPQHERERRRGSESYYRIEERAVVTELCALPVHARGIARKAGVEPVLYGERLCRLHARYALVEAAGDLGIYLPDPAVEHGEPALEVAGSYRHERHNDYDAQREQRVEREHYYHRAYHICDVPAALIYVPRDNGAYGGGIAHHPRVHPAHAVGAEIGHRERLQVVERSAAHVAQEIHLQLAAVEGRNIVERHGDEQAEYVQDYEGRQPFEGVVCDEVIERVLLEERQYGVEHTDEHGAYYHGGEHAAVGL